MVPFAELDALVASYLHESNVDTHAAGAAIARVMQMRLDRMKAGRR